jgi:glycerol kinase
VLKALNTDSGVALTELKVDGGMIQNNTLTQFQADILDVPVITPVVTETTALGAAKTAGLAVGFWDDLKQLRSRWREGRRRTPNMEDSERHRQIAL